MKSGEPIIPSSALLRPGHACSPNAREGFSTTLATTPILLASWQCLWSTPRVEVDDAIRTIVIQGQQLFAEIAMGLFRLWTCANYFDNRGVFVE